MDHSPVTQQKKKKPSSFEGGLELQGRLWQQCVTAVRAQQQALQEHSTMLLRRTGR